MHTTAYIYNIYIYVYVYIYIYILYTYHRYIYTWDSILRSKPAMAIEAIDRQKRLVFPGSCERETEEANPELEELQHRKQCMWPICEWDPCVPVAVGMAEWWLRLKVVVDLDHPFHPWTSCKKVCSQGTFSVEFRISRPPGARRFGEGWLQGWWQRGGEGLAVMPKSTYEYPICLWMNVDDTHAHTLKCI